jgi:hypothetical protein
MTTQSIFALNATATLANPSVRRHLDPAAQLDLVHRDAVRRPKRRRADLGVS